MDDKPTPIRDMAARIAMAVAFPCIFSLVFHPYTSTKAVRWACRVVLLVLGRPDPPVIKKPPGCFGSRADHRNARVPYSATPQQAANCTLTRITLLEERIKRQERAQTPAKVMEKSAPIKPIGQEERCGYCYPTPELRKRAAEIEALLRREGVNRAYHGGPIRVVRRKEILP